MSHEQAAFNPVSVIQRKRDGFGLPEEDIRAFVAGAVKGDIPTYQVSAFLMATYFSDMDIAETATLTRAMIESGQTLHFRERNDGGCYVDKHSTGGIGDKVSLILAPLAAAMGLKVPMVAGRGLGHTGGTLDKLESIPGFSVKPPLQTFINQVERVGCAIMGQSDDFVPADKIFYALRDVTATIECVPLITASILSKKAAEGISGLVMDIKVGPGAFMKTLGEGQALARSLHRVGKELGIKVRTLLTDMSQPLGYAVGNSLEVLECMDLLAQMAGGKRVEHPAAKLPPPALSSDLRDLCIELTAQMAVAGNCVSSLSAARILARKALADGRALAKFREMVACQGGREDLFEKPALLPISSKTIEIAAHRAGVVSRIDALALGRLVVDIGGGRHKAEDTIDPAVGVVIYAKVGMAVKKGAPLLRVHYSEEHPRLPLGELKQRAAGLVEISQKKTVPPRLIKRVIT